MKKVDRRSMRIIVMFDLHIKEEEDRKAYTTFRKFLLNDGFYMMQYSIYVRVTTGMDDADKHINRIQQNLPKNGMVNCLLVTEKQYASMYTLVGKIDKMQKNIDENSIIEL